jgi:choline/glycine/proline betaine transport protein
LSLGLSEGTAGIISTAVTENVATALFVMLEQLPLTGITSFVGIILVVVFFVTSSDSGSLVVDSIASGGKLESPVPQRVFWAVLEGVVASDATAGRRSVGFANGCHQRGFALCGGAADHVLQHLQGAEL